MAKQTFECRMKDYDGDNDWEFVEAYDAEGAAEHYAEECANRSGGEMLVREDQDEETVFVRAPDGAITQWTVAVYYITGYSANQVKAA